MSDLKWTVKGFCRDKRRRGRDRKGCFTILLPSLLVTIFCVTISTDND